MTEEEKLRLKILKIKLRRLLHRGAKWTKKQSKKLGLVVGLTLVSICNANGQSFRDLLASARSEYKSTKDLFAWVENQANRNPAARELISQELSNQVQYLAEELMLARNDSLAASIDRLRNPRTRTREIRNNFRDATGVSKIAFHCLATQCAADYRALKAMGLEDIIPKDLKQASALCRAYAQNADIRPFVYEVENTDEAIKACIREHHLSGGCFIFYPRDRKGNYHAVALDMPDGDFLYHDGIDEFLTSSANNERKGTPVKTASFRKKAPGRKALVIDKLGFFITMLERHIAGKTLAEQTAFLYRGGAEEFMNHLQKVTNQPRENILASIEKTIFDASKDAQDNRSMAGLYMLGLVLILAKRNGKNSSDLFYNLVELSEQETVMDKIEYLNKDLGKKFSESLSILSPEEKKSFYASINDMSTDNNGIVTDPDVIALQAFSFQQQWLSTQTWHEVAPASKKTSLKEQGKKTTKTTVKTPQKTLSRTRSHVKA